ncbi:hypothetical protein NEOLEDRAFT_1164515 [Neolentinus lepideus HHB14362 ss-1]|uniref:WD40 repeat-like protein n=1 Tax=Neolentinus lepideus HHB14362 ss-1 TaxID=1314782 RepID=A0A165PZB9_9AGAM|nr:hypothetical protein NEOLEDRAFT_1164515 [Neolentinus lepideus HHB14362 ss-1]
MSDLDVFAAMGISGFGKSTKKKTLDPKRFDKMKREELLPTKNEIKEEQRDDRSTSPGPLKAPESEEPEFDPDEMGPPPPPRGGSADDDEPEYDPDEPEYEALDAPQFPTTHELVLKDHTKVISALTLDPSGARILSGSHDYDCKLWDFGGMDMRCKPFKTWEPAGTYYIHDVKYSHDGQWFLVISGTLQPKLYDRDGEEHATYVKGDPYIRDMKHTAGHVGEILSCAWHPKDSQYFITGSADSTIRIWDAENRRKHKSIIVVKSKERGARTKVNTCAYSPDGNLIAGACLDGALHIWKTNSNFVRPDMSIEGAHTKASETGSLVFSVDGRTILTRGGDDTVKLWDIRSFKKPVSARSGLTTLYPTTNAAFSPDEKYIVTGAGATTKGAQGRLMFLHRDNLEIAREMEMETTPVKVMWHSKINQIVTGLADGSIHVLYSPVTSINGAKLLLNKGPAKKPTIEDMSDALAAPTIITPHALPMYRDGDAGRGSKRKREKERMDPRKSKRPELPVTGPGKGGRVGASATQHVVQNLVRNTTRDEDPREALLKYAQRADEDPQWTSALSDNTNGQTLSSDSVDVSPDADSPATPVSHVTDVTPKIDIDGAAVESDARHEPAPAKTEKVDDASTCPQNGSPQAPESILVDPPKGTPPPPTGELLDDVKMAEQAEPNGVPKEEVEEAKVDVEMDSETPLPAPNGDTAHSPISIPTGSSTTAVASDSMRIPDDRDEDEPPAKRPRKFSDADKASINHSATPPPASASPSVVNGATSPQHQGPSTLSLQQHRFCVSTIRTLKKLKDAAPFLKPVDIVALNIPHYPSIIKHPMDFETISNKLAASNPAKPDPNSASPRYHNADEFVSDVRLIFKNCQTFNGPDHVITHMGKRVEGVFDKQIKQMPPPDEPKQIIVKKASPIPPSAPPASAKKPPTRRPSASVPAIRRSEENMNGRPKREIHPPPPRDLPYVDGPKRHRKAKAHRDDGTAEQLKYCSKILTELHRKQHYNIASPFYEPVDWVKLDIPAYPKIIKKPMDLSTIRKKLDDHRYRNVREFREDFKLMITNCYTFNPIGTPVNQAGVELDRLFDEKWLSLPPLREGSDGEDEDDEETDDERARAIAEMESQIETMKANLAGLKTKPVKEKKKEKKKEKAAPVASSSKAASKPAKHASSSKKKSTKKTIPDDDVLSFEQKKDLSETIQKLDGTRLEKVIQIIHEGVPEIRDSTEEIELEIDLLPAAVLTKLYNFVLRPLQRNAAPKRSRTGKGTGTGGLKRKSMDEDVETEKIRQLEERMRLFEQGGAANLTSTGSRADMSEHSSDSSDGSDSSGSDSE